MILHDTNLAEKVRTELSELAAAHGATFTLLDFTDVPVAECIRRDATRTGNARVGETVIRRMSNLLPVKEFS